MSKSDLQLQIDAARAYQSVFVPALFEQWSAIMADAAHLQIGQSVLDVACGTGILASEVASRTGTSGGIVGIDPNPGMLAVAMEREPKIDWHEGVAEKLPFHDESFDAVMCQFGIMFFRDPVQSIREMLRVLKPSGHLLIAVWDSIENIPGYKKEQEIIERLGGAKAGEAVNAPFFLGGGDGVCTMLLDAGADSISMSTHRGKVRFPSIQSMIEAEVRGWLPVMGVNLNEEKINCILEEALQGLAPFTAPEGKVVFDITAQVISAQKSPSRSRGEVRGR